MHTAKSRPCDANASTDIITYRYNGKLVYVPVAPSYTQALEHAREAFPQLNKLRDAVITLSMNTPAGRDGRDNTHVCISKSAWPKLVSHLSRYQIIDVHEQPGGCVGPIPDIRITYVDVDKGEEKTEPAPPYYGQEDGIVGDEKAAVYVRPRPLQQVKHWFLRKRRGFVCKRDVAI